MLLTARRLSRDAHEIRFAIFRSHCLTIIYVTYGHSNFDDLSLAFCSKSISEADLTIPPSYIRWRMIRGGDRCSYLERNYLKFEKKLNFFYHIANKDGISELHVGLFQSYTDASFQHHWSIGEDSDFLQYYIILLSQVQHRLHLLFSSFPAISRLVEGSCPQLLCGIPCLLLLWILLHL